MPKCDFSKVHLQLYWNHTLASVFSCKCSGYFQNNFFKNTAGVLLLWTIRLAFKTGLQSPREIKSRRMVIRCLNSSRCANRRTLKTNLEQDNFWKKTPNLNRNCMMTYMTFQCLMNENINFWWKQLCNSRKEINSIFYLQFRQ